MMRTGGYNTPIHKHIVEEFHCAFNGSEEFMFIQPGQKELQHPWSSIDVDSVDLIKYPELQHIKYASIALNKGDCIYIPTGSYYKISSTDHFNSGIVVWFSFFTKSHQFEGTGCDKNDNFMPASDVNITWRYDGYGDLETLHLDTNILRTVLLTSGDEKGRVWLKQFTENLIKGDGEVGVYDNERKQFSDILDPTGRGYVTVKEVKALSIDVLKKMILAFDHTDDSSTLDYEYRLINHEAIINFTRMLASNGPDPGFHSNEFIEQYVNQLGGTRQKAMEILTGLGVGQGELVTMEMVEKNIEKTIEKFRNAKLKIRADRKPWYEHLLKHKEMF
uniref:Uncharacterized protein LOC102809682 n=1 Tax=Saccoglossus kowalevskii TaxID=10224 RepID=A0ABM0M815_SACKO|nr:PREDICTED: uncharacterized protein LOC102809682 [Saccoglossus kowalevskii]